MEQEKRYCVFVVDPDPDSTVLFRAHFQDCGHLVHFCGSAREAFGIMQAVYPDICIVRDRLPDMDGQVALARLAGRFPHAIRVISGQEKHRVRLMRAVAVGIAHRHICFPWESNGVAAVLNRDLGLRRRLRVRRCWRFLEQEELVPVFPEVIVRVEEVLAGEGFDMAELARVVSSDPAAAAMLLKVVNSAAFPKSAAIGSVEHAVSYLGVDRLREILLFVCASRALPPDAACLDQAREVAAHCFACARLAAEIAAVAAPGREREAATAALLHDIGKLVFLAARCGGYLETVAYRQAFSVSPDEVEREEFGVTHAELGSSLLLWWSLPMTMVEAAAGHHDSIGSLGGVGRCVAAADRCLAEAGMGVVTDLDTLAPAFPVDDWRRSAAMLAGQGLENPLTN